MKFKLSDVPIVFFVNCLITLILSSGMMYSDMEHWFQYLYSAFIFSNCIGFSLYGFVEYFGPWCARFRLLPRLGAMVLLFLLGGIVGTELGLGIFYVFLDARFSFVDYIRLLELNLVMSIVFGGAAVVYFSLRERAQRLAMTVKEKELNEERLTRLKTRAELEALQTKVNPHFLFNTLNSIASLISENPKAAEDTVERLSELFRHSLRHSERSTVTVAEELDLIRTYLEIEKVRLGDRLKYVVRCEEPVRDAVLPALLIQPLVENSIKYAVAPEIAGGEIVIEAKESNGKCVISVSDSGKGFEVAGDQDGFGLRSIQERLRLVYGDNATLEIVKDGRSEIIITLPIGK